MNKELRSFCINQHSEFSAHLENYWGVTALAQRLNGAEKPLFRKFLAFRCVCGIFSGDSEMKYLLHSASESVNLSLILAIKGSENSAFVLLRQCIELTYKHVFFSSHPVEFQWIREREDYKEISHQFLLDYLGKTREVRSSPLGQASIEIITTKYQILSRHVHVQNPDFTEFFPRVTSTPNKLLNSYASSLNPVLENLCFLLVLFNPAEFSAASAIEKSLIRNALSKKLSTAL